MYQYIVGFVFGVYVGTRYDMTNYVDNTETSVRAFLENIKKKKEPLPEPEPKIDWSLRRFWSKKGKDSE